METIFITDKNEIDKTQLFNVYRGGIRNNAKHYSEPEKAIEEAHWEYLVDFLENQHGFLAVLKDGNQYISALRVLPKENNEFFCEAFETAEAFRGKGFGKQLYRDVIKHIAQNTPHFQLEAHTWKTNQASIKSHLGVGFEIAKDFVEQKDGTKSFDDVTLRLEK